MLSDLRHALRSLLKTPTFTLVAVLTLGVGLGATATVATWIERVLLNPLPGTAAPDRLVALETLAASGEMIDTSYPDYRDYAAQTKTLSDILVFKERPLNLSVGAHSERVWAEVVSGNFFTTLGVQPLLGRFFLAADRADEPAAAPVAVLSENFWRHRFAADPKILGQTIKLNQHEFTVIGVAPGAFPGSLNGLVFDLWVPLALQPALTGSGNWLEWRDARALHTLARLASGATLAQAHAELAGLARQLAAAHPDTNRGIGVAVVPVTESPHGAHRRLGPALVILLGACGLLLLIVCANLSNLLFVRATTRQREMCIRQALGAGWARLMRPLLAESLLLSAAGALLAVLLALWMMNLLQLLIPATTMPVALTGQLDWRVLALVVALALAVTAVAGLTPSRWAARTDLVELLRGGRGAGVSPRAEFWRGLLVSVQVAFALAAIVGAGLAWKSFRASRRADPGFDPHGVLLAGLKFDASGYQPAQGLAFLDQLQQRLAGQPGVASVAFAEDVPLGLEGGSWADLTLPGYTPAADENMKIYRNLVSPGYFALLRIPLLVGRDFLASDEPTAPLVALVNETFARRYFGSTEVVGRTFRMWGGERTLRIVGVVADGKYHSLDERAHPYFYLSLRQFLRPGTGLAIHLRAIGTDPLALLPTLRRAMQAIDPAVPVFEALTLEDYISASSFAPKAVAELLGPLSALALALSALGLYGVLSFTVAQRTAEIGVRLALGAQAAEIVRLVLRRGLALTGLGVALGLLAAAAVTRLLASALYGVSPFEPALLLLVAALVAAVALLACWLPARRATRVDPMIALRAE